MEGQGPQPSVSTVFNIFVKMGKKNLKIQASVGTRASQPLEQQRMHIQFLLWEAGKTEDDWNTLTAFQSLAAGLRKALRGKEDNIVVLFSRQQACKADKRRLKHKAALLKVKGTVAACPIENYRQLVIEVYQKKGTRKKAFTAQRPSRSFIISPSSLTTTGLTLLTPLSLHLLGVHSSASISHMASRSRDTDYSEKLRKS